MRQEMDHDYPLGQLAAAAVIVMLLLLEPTLAEPAYVNTWTKQLGTPSTDVSWGISADGLGNVYISGYTRGALGGPNAGNYDAFVSKYDDAGTLAWTKQLGTSSFDESRGVSADGLGNIYISGRTQGALGGPNAGNYDAFVSKYDAAGTLAWTKQLGTASIDVSWGVSADGLGNVYVSGYTQGALGGPSAGSSDAFVSKYDATGTLAWAKQLGTASTDASFGVSADGLGNVYISGYTFGALGGPSAGSSDAFVRKYDAAGTLAWTKQLGTASIDESLGVSADGLGNVYISGYTLGALGGPSAGNDDAFVSKYDAAGTLAWTKQLGTASIDESLGVSADGLGNVYISGYTDGALGGPSAGSSDAFISKYDAAGTLAWTKQLGTSLFDISQSVSADGLGNVYISGYTDGALGGPSVGSYDAFVARFSPVSIAPEPSGLALAGIAAAGLLAVAWRRQHARQVQ